MTKPRFSVLDLFSGIGGFSLGLETISDDSLLRDRQVCAEGAEETLAERPANRRHSETERAVEAAAVANVIVGGFPCQDISVAGKRAGIDSPRSGLWGEMRRTIGLVRPEFVIVENVSALLSGAGGRWFHRVLGDMAALGYDAEWHCIPASAVGAPHIRDRVWIIAYAPGKPLASGQPRESVLRVLSNADSSQGRADEGKPNARSNRRDDIVGICQGMADAKSIGGDGLRESGKGDQRAVRGCRGELSDPDSEGLEKREGQDASGAGPIVRSITVRSERWAAEPDVGRVADGVPKRVDRLKCLGNAIVPEIARRIGSAILNAAQKADG